MSKEIRTPKKMIAFLVQRVNGLEKLNVAYRTRGRPKESTLDALAVTANWKNVLHVYRDLSGE